ncbi:MAG TPA: hypothetical protein VMM77_04635 [Gemmatimonadaceae bacterium]|nr:hypothetical protein [Gemmatimonadaceae bacterium]
MNNQIGLRIFCLVCVIAACGDDVAKPITKIEVHDLRDSLSRIQGPRQELMRAMSEPDVSQRIIYEPPVDLTLRRGDSLVTAPFGITAAPDSATTPAARR